MDHPRALAPIDPVAHPIPRADRWGALLVIAPLAVAALRHTGEVILGAAWSDGAVLQNNAVFYVVTELAMLLLLRVATRRPVEALAPWVAAGLLIGTLPPLLDGLVFRQPGVEYRYFTAFHWLLRAPEQPLGETVCVWLTIAAVGGFTGWVTRRVRPAVLAAAGAWGVSQALGFGLSGLATWLVPEEVGPQVLVHHLLMLSVGLACFAALRPAAIGYSCGRIHHALPFACVTAVGARLCGDHWALAIIKASVTLLAGALVVAANDWYDREQDGRAAGSMEAGDAWVIALFQMMVAATVAWFLREAIPAVALFAATTLAYHHPAIRLKRWLGAGHAAEAISALACFLIGALRPAPPFLPASAPVSLALALVPAGFFLGTVFKDYKDVASDEAAGVRTLYTALARRGVGPRRTHAIAAALLAACLLGAAGLAVALGAAPLAGAVLAALGALTVPSLLAGAPRAAVERTIWVVTAFLVIAALAVPSPALPGAARFPYASPGICHGLR